MRKLKFSKFELSYPDKTFETWNNLKWDKFKLNVFKCLRNYEILYPNPRSRFKLRFPFSHETPQKRFSLTLFLRLFI